MRYLQEFSLTSGTQIVYRQPLLACTLHSFYITRYIFWFLDQFLWEPLHLERENTPTLKKKYQQHKSQCFNAVNKLCFKEDKLSAKYTNKYCLHKLFSCTLCENMITTIFSIFTFEK